MLAWWIDALIGAGVAFISFRLTILRLRRKINKPTEYDSKHLPSHAIEMQWEPTAVSEGATVGVYIKRGKQSILIGETDIHLENFGTTLESLNTTAAMRAMEMNSMGIKWDGDAGTMIPLDVADRYKEDRDKFQKRVKELEKTVDEMTTPEGLGILLKAYLAKVSPKSTLGTIRIVNEGHLLAEIPPGRPSVLPHLRTSDQLRRMP